MDEEEKALLRRQVELAEASARARKRWAVTIVIALVVVAAVVWIAVRANDRAGMVDRYRLDGPAVATVV